MPRKKWITKSEILRILKEYSTRYDEFEQIGTEEHFFKSKYVKGYTISIQPEIQHRNEKTGRVVVSHTQSGGKRTFCDIWKRDSNGKLQFMFRNPWDKPFTDCDYIKDLEEQIIELKEFVQKLQKQSAERHEPANVTGFYQENSEYLKRELDALKSENEALKIQIADTNKRYDELIQKTKHNARGAGRKANLARLEAQAKRVQDLINSGHTPAEVQKIMNISRSTFFKYKKITQTKDR